MNLLLLLQEGPAETTDYMILGFVVIFGAMLAYVISLWVRRRNLLKDIELLEQLEEQE
ncbi:MAG: hypothetical protein JXB38_02360 [Anaerolineales bacterium]|nr:hypothetical protein [Anaerolineales bacterium]